MADVHYGVVEQDGVWIIIGDGLRFGSFADKDRAERAARNLADISSGLTVQLHVQDETGELLPPERLD
ncbi:MAG: hypothetical protein JWO72_2459 [Caulobacteraceae bacterium]|nr:hypothetical protein [Caulobacteraceae bacterium]